MKYLAEKSHSRIALCSFFATGILIATDHSIWAVIVILSGALLDGALQNYYDI